MTRHQLTLSERHFPDDVVVVAVSGELDIATAVVLDDYLIHLAATGHHRLVLDTALLTFCDCSGIRVLIRGRARVAQRGWLRLAAVDPRLRKILAILSLIPALPAFADVPRAILGAQSPEQIMLGATR
jgi:anti-sigma B factor antagonist